MGFNGIRIKSKPNAAYMTDSHARFCLVLRIPQAASVQQTTIGTAGAACEIRKRYKKV
jgi:hypothetical protein